MESARGFSLLTGTIFIIGEVAGVGILSIPKAVSEASWAGLAVIVFCAYCAGYAGIYLAKCWLILEDRFPEYRDGLTRKPFATISYHAYGPYMSAFVSFLINFTSIAASTVIILLTANLVTSLTAKWLPEWGSCEWAPIIGLILLVPTMFGSPVDFWPIAYGAMGSTTIGSILLLISIILHISRRGIVHEHEFKIETFPSSFGTILFAFGGASAFPNFQNDMKDKSKFPKAVFLGFLGLLMLYLPVAGLGFGAFGLKTTPNVINSINIAETDLSILVTIVRICFLIHCFCVVLIVINPAFLDLEELLRVPKEITWKRILFRTFLMILMVFLGETSPKFDKILDLIGGTTLTLMSFVLPPIFYLKLCRNAKHEEDNIECPISVKLAFLVIIVSGILGGIASTYTTLKSWEPLSEACYLQNRPIYFFPGHKPHQSANETTLSFF